MAYIMTIFNMSRQKYRWGAKQFLANMEIGERVQYDGEFPWRSLQRIACALLIEYNSRWRFETTKAGRYITRVM